MYYGNTTFVYHNDFNTYMNVEGAVSKDVFDYLFNVGVGKFLPGEERNTFINYLKNGIQSIFNLMKIWMIIQIMMDWKPYWR